MELLRLAVVVRIMLPFCLVAAAAAAFGTAKCPKNWHVYNETSCLTLFTYQEPWEEARRQCEFVNPGSDLAVLDSEDKKSYVHTMVHADSPFLKCGLLGMDAYWIGASDRQRERQFEWLDSGRRLEYANWGFLEPNNLLGEDCVEMQYSDGKWNDEDCGRKQCFVCETRAEV